MLQPSLHGSRGGGSRGGPDRGGFGGGGTERRESTGVLNFLIKRLLGAVVQCTVSILPNSGCNFFCGIAIILTGP